MKAVYEEKVGNVSNWCITGIHDNVVVECLCGKVSSVLYSFLNKETKETIEVCFTCIGKFMLEKKEDAVVLCKQFTYQKTSKNPKRLCRGCHKHNINNEEESWRTICKSCYGAGTRECAIPILGNNLCEGCFTLNISPTSNNKICTTCYKEKAININTMDESLLRPCSICGLNKLLKSDPSFKDKCTDCFKMAKLKEEVEEKRECIVCKELSIPVSKPDYVDKCTDCFRTTNANAVKRECSICKALKIPITSPAYKDKCMDCYKLDATKMRECSICFSLTIPCNKPKYITKCDKCYVPSTKSPRTKDNKEVKDKNTLSSYNNNRQCNQCHEYKIPSTAPEFKKKCNECLIKQDIPAAGIPDIKVYKGNLDMISGMMKGKK